VIEYTEVANRQIEKQEIGFTNKRIDLLVYRSLAKPLMFIFFVGIYDIWD